MSHLPSSATSWSRLEHQPAAHAALGAIGDLDFAAVEIDDPLDDGQAEARALARRLGGEEGIENFAQDFRRDAAAGIVDLHHDHRVARVKVARLARAVIAVGFRQPFGPGPDGQGRRLRGMAWIALVKRLTKTCSIFMPSSASGGKVGRELRLQINGMMAQGMLRPEAARC